MTPSKEKPTNVFVLAYVFPPMAAIGFQRPLRVCNYLNAKGISVTVFAGHPASASEDITIEPSLNDLIDKGIRVRRIPSLHPMQWAVRLRANLFPKMCADKHAPVPLPNASSAKINTQGSWLANTADKIFAAFSVPDRYSSWILISLPALLLEILFKRPACLFVTGPPWSPVMAASIAGWITRTPVYVDYRDPWNLNPYHRNPPRRFILWMEKWILKQATAVISNTDSMAALYKSKYPELADRIFPVYNGVDERTIRKIAQVRDEIEKPNAGNFVVSHLGTLYSSRMPRCLAGLLAQVALRWNGARDIRFKFFGWVENPEILKTAFALAGCAQKLEMSGQVSSRVALEEQAKADVLLLLQSGTTLQVPAKIFEYALSGPPILCFAEEKSETARMISEHGLGKQMQGNESPEEILNFLRAVRDGNFKVDGLKKFLEKFSGETQSHKICEIILPKL